MSDTTVSILVAQVKDLVVSSVSDGKLDTNEILNIGMFVAQKASSVVSLSLDEKKALVVKVVEAALKEHLSPSQLDQTGAKFALNMLPTVLSIAMDAASGKLDLSAKAVKGCFFSCLSAAKKDLALPPAVLSEVKKVVDSSVVKALVPESVVSEAEHVLKILQPVESGASTPEKVEEPVKAAALAVVLEEKVEVAVETVVETVVEKVEAKVVEKAEVKAEKA